MSANTSWQRLFDFSQVGEARLNQPEYKDKKLKWAYAITRMLAQVKRHHTKIQQKLEDIRQANYAEDDKGLLIENDRGGYRMKKEKLSGQTTEERNLINAPDLEIDPFFVTKLPDDLLEHELEAFTGIIITQETAAKYRADQERYLDDLDNEETLADLLNAIRTAGPLDYLAAKLVRDESVKPFLDALRERMPVAKVNGESQITESQPSSEHVVEPEPPAS